MNEYWRTVAIIVLMAVAIVTGGGTAGGFLAWTDDDLRGARDYTTLFALFAVAVFSLAGVVELARGY